MEYAQRSKCLDSSDLLVGRDSGFLSSENYNNTESEIDVHSSSQNYSNYNRLDSGVDLSASVSGLSISSKSIPFSPQPKSNNYDEYVSWENYFYPDEDGDTQLHIAIMERLVDAALTLMSLVPHPSVLNFQNDASQTPLHVAVLTKQPRLVRQLVAGGASVTLRDRFGNTPLHLAAASGDLGSVQALTLPLSASELEGRGWRYELQGQYLPQGIDLLNYEGLAPAHIASLSGHSEVLKTLHWLRADLNAGDGKGGRTPLHLAVQRGLSTVVSTLAADCGVQLDKLSYGGLSAYEMATACSHDYLASELLAHGATLVSKYIIDDGRGGYSSDSSSSSSYYSSEDEEIL